MRVHVVEHLPAQGRPLGNAARWGCESGHEWQGPLLPARKARCLGPEGFALMARWWRQEAGGVEATCPRCVLGHAPTMST